MTCENYARWENVPSHGQLQEDLVTARAEVERLKRCYATATGKAHGCGAGAVIRVECKQMASLREEIKQLRSALSSLVAEQWLYAGETLSYDYDWECRYCEHQWKHRGEEHHADNCLVSRARIILKENLLCS